MGELPAVLHDWLADLRAGRPAADGGADGGAASGMASGVDDGPEPAWASCGAMALTGHPDGPPLAPTVPLVARLDGALAVVRELAAARGHPFEHGPGRGLTAGALLGERAAALGLTRGGTSSAGGAARLVRAADGWLAVNLARPDDVDLLPAWLETDIETEAGTGAGAEAEQERAGGGDGHAGAAGAGQGEGDGHLVRPWRAVEAALASRRVAELTERAQLLGLPVAAVVDPARAAGDVQARARGQRFPFAPFLLDGRPPDGGGRPPGGRSPGGRSAGDGLHREGGFTVVDLSSLWAGPLCAHLLGLAGGRVIKVESIHRLDGARRGPAAFYDLLHAGHASVTLDLTSAAGRADLRRLIGAADVVIEASRPRAMEQLGIDPAEAVRRNPSLTWVTITGYGRTGPWRQRPAFGDDAAAAAGAVAVDAAGEPVFLADAIADPVTGVVAAAAALGCLAAGGGRHVDIAMREAVGALLAGRPVLPERDHAALRAPDGTWYVEHGGQRVTVAAPRIRPPACRAAAPGADNAILTGDPLLAGGPVPTGAPSPAGEHIPGAVPDPGPSTGPGPGTGSGTGRGPESRRAGRAPC